MESIARSEIKLNASLQQIMLRTTSCISILLNYMQKKKSDSYSLESKIKLKKNRKQKQKQKHWAKVSVCDQV